MPAPSPASPVWAAQGGDVTRGAVAVRLLGRCHCRLRIRLVVLLCWVVSASGDGTRRTFLISTSGDNAHRTIVARNSCLEHRRGHGAVKNRDVTRAVRCRGFPARDQSAPGRVRSLAVVGWEEQPGLSGVAPVFVKGG